MDQIKKNISGLTDEELVNQYQNYKSEYTEEAIRLLEEEIQQRKIDIENQQSINILKNIPDITHLDEKDFIRFDHGFNRIDLELAIAILKENKILFFVDNPSSTNTIPLDSEADKQYTIHVYTKTADEAHQLLDEHFEKIDGKYQLKNMSIMEQLKSFSFSQLHLTEKEAAEKVEVELSEKEKEVIIKYGTIIISNVDKIEQEIGRFIFYFDAIQPLISHISDDSDITFSKTELLTILEILQISCNNKDFPEFMENAILSLISFFK
jgi:hypothetical protein